jgi:hypothetical protein
MTASPPSPNWPERAWGLALLGGLVGLASHFILRVVPEFGNPDPALLALANFLGLAALSFAYIVERSQPQRAAAFAIIAGGIVASVVHHGGTAGFDSIAVWRLVSAGLAIAIAVPLFQAWSSAPAGGLRTLPPYPAAHDRAWTNLVLWCASLAFVGIVWMLVGLLAALFDLIGIDALRQLIARRWFVLALSGGALGGGIGLLRDRDPILLTLRRVVTTVLGVLAPVLAAGLVVFLLALPWTGLAPLWSATRSTTPIMLSCVIAGLILMNAVIGDSDADESCAPVLRWSARALAATLLPLGVIAAVSVAARIDQHGLSPDRLWAVTFTAIACAYGVAALHAIGTALAGRDLAGWAARLRRGNLRLAVVLCGLALLLSTPLIDFGAISTRNQLARLAVGKVKPEAFDWAALRFDFGPAGKAAVERLARTGSGAVRPAAELARQADNRWSLGDRRAKADARRRQSERYRAAAPRGVAMPPDLVDAMIEAEACPEYHAVCTIVWRPGASRMIAIAYGTRPDDVSTTVLYASDRGWSRDGRDPRRSDVRKAELAGIVAAAKSGKSEVRNVARRQLFVDGKPIGEAFE